MKNKIYLSLLSVFFLTGCNSQAPIPEESNPEQNNEETEEQVTDDQAEDTETDEEITDENEENEENEEEITYQYKINPNTFSVEPIDEENSDEEDRKSTRLNSSHL